MSTYVKCGKEVGELAQGILREFATHKPLLDTGVTIDFVFAHADLDEQNMPKGPALRLQGCAALAIARIIPLKQRVLGRGDAEVAIDGDWWNDASAEQRRAVLDHELHHLAPRMDKLGKPKFDDVHRPLLKMRRHDFQFGWFAIIAARHGAAAMECIQAKAINDQAGSVLFSKEVWAKIKSG